MDAIFLKLFNMSVTASWLVLAVVLLRLLLKKAPKAITVFLWALVGIRLICPFSLESVLSLLPSAELLPANTVYSHSTFEPSVKEVLEYAGHNPVSYDIGLQDGSIGFSEFTAPDTDYLNPLYIFTVIASLVWLIGMAAMLVYTAVSYLRIHQKVREAAPLQDNIWLCDRIDTPFIFGVIRPRIYLPSGMNGQDADYVIAHERAHLKRRDHWWKPLGFLLLTVYWFNPVLWIAYILLCRDIELACDEKVIQTMGAEIKKPYSDALINCSVSRKSIAACPLAFGEVGVKGRVKSVLSYKEPAFWIVIVAILAGVAVAVCFLTTPKTPEEDGGIVSNTESIHTDYEGVYISVESIYSDYSEDKVFNVVWHNETLREITYGETYAIEYKEGTQWRDVSKEEINFLTIGYSLKPHSTAEKSYSTQRFDISGSGTYRLRSWFSNGDGNRYHTWIEFVISASASNIGGADEPAYSITGKSLTLSDVVSLAKKGDALTWADFEDYDYVVTGSGLYIRRYEIDEMFSLLIGGTMPDEDAWYFYLHASDAWDEKIDIRTGDVKAFINEHKNNPVVKNVSYGYHACPVDGTGDNFGKMVELGGMPPNAQASSIESLATVKITSVGQLQNFKDHMQSVMNFNWSYADTPSFNTVSKEYTDEYFENTTLYFVYASAGTTAHRFSPEYATKSLGVLSVGIRESVPEAGDTAMQGWLVCIGIPNEDVKDITAVDARISSVNYPDSGTANAALIKRYVFSDSQEAVIKPSFSLYDNGVFTFTFSGYSSYYGVGTYDLENNRLTLKTDDGQYIYCFDAVNNTMVFDAAASSDALWHSDLYDGCVFE